MWSVKEELGKQYIYVSKNAASDVAAANFFGKAAAWVSGGTYSLNDRVTSSSIQYKCIQACTGRTTAPLSDTSYWEFDKENFQTYATGKTYSVGHKTNYSNEHYICAVEGSTGAFQVGNWTKVIVSNRLYPYRLQNTAITLINADARFVSSETLDFVNNTATYLVNMLLSNGKWNETLTTSTKYVKIIGQSKWKTSVYNNQSLIHVSNVSLIPTTLTTIKASNCIVSSSTINGGTLELYFSYKVLFVNLGIVNYSVNLYHSVSCSYYLWAQPTYVTFYFINTSILKNCVFGQIVNFDSMSSVNVGNIDGNYYNSTVKIATVSQANIAAVRATAPFQNVNSLMNASAITLSSDYTLPTGCVLLNAGLLGNHIGAEGLGVTKDTSNSLAVANGAIYRNGRVVLNNIYRDQVAKVAQAGASNTITLNADASSVNDEYIGFRIWIYQGTGIGQTKTITAYNGTTKVATVDTNWSVNPDNTSYYEIMDAEITSAIIDLGASKTIKKINFSALNNYDTSTLTVLTQHVGTDDCRTMNSDLNYELKTGLLADLSDGTWRKFKQDESLMLDGAGVGCGDASYNADTVASTTLTFRYYQIRVKLHK